MDFGVITVNQKKRRFVIAYLNRFAESDLKQAVSADLLSLSGIVNALKRLIMLTGRVCF
jgi:hypothetical protein